MRTGVLSKPMGSILLTALIIVLTLGGIAYAVERSRGPDAQDAPPPVYSLLPGDIKYESPSGNFKFYFPVTTSIILSIVLTLLLSLFS